MPRDRARGRAHARGVQGGGQGQPAPQLSDIRTLAALSMKYFLDRDDLDIDTASRIFERTIPGGKLYSGSWDKTIKVWSLEAGGGFGREIMTLSGHTSWVNALAIYDSKLYSGNGDGYGGAGIIKVWSV